MPKYPDEPNMSDMTILFTVEDLINRALGPPDGNVVNFKIIQLILHNLARQQRMLEQRVEIRASELEVDSSPKKKKGRERSTVSPSSKSSPRRRGREVITEEREKAQRDKSKGRKREDTDKEAAKEKEKANKKEKENTEKAAQNEREKLEKQEKKNADKEKKQAEKEQTKAQREQSSASSKGEKKDKGQVTIVEKGPTTRTDTRTRASIEVVTQSQFALLEAAVKELRDLAAPQPLQLPDYDKLKSGIAKGTASLPEAMQTLQVDARVKAAEQAINRMTGLLTQLAAAGALPEDFVEKIAEVEESEGPKPDEAAKSRMSIGPRKSVAIDPKATQSQAGRMESRPSTAAPSTPVTPRPSAVTTARPSLASKPSQMSTGRPSSVSVPSAVSIQGVTYDEMNAALKDLKDDIYKNLNNMTNRATTAAEMALHTAQAGVTYPNIRPSADERSSELACEQHACAELIGGHRDDLRERLQWALAALLRPASPDWQIALDVVLKLDSRISYLHSLVSDYDEQLSGFDSGLSTQMQSFQDQMAQIRTDLKNGLIQLENVNNNAETAAVMELTERYDELATELDTTLHAHKSLTALQTQLSGEMHSLVECVEMLREQKCDRDEVLDGLRDKADSSRLAGLMAEVEFAAARADFERRIDLCHDKFRRQDAVWTAAIRDLTCTTDKKAEIVDLLSARDDAQIQLQELCDKIKVLAAVLGEPKAALLTRKLAVGAVCGSCQVAALMEPNDAVGGAPPRLPVLRPPPVAAPDEFCLAEWVGPEQATDKHICHRWCGGSHTLISEATKKEQAPPVQLQTVPTKKFTDYGSDGRLYMFEEELQACVDCNLPPTEQGHRTESPQLGLGAGDAQPTREPSLVCTCPLLK